MKRKLNREQYRNSRNILMSLLLIGAMHSNVAFSQEAAPIKGIMEDQQTKALNFPATAEYKEIYANPSLVKDFGNPLVNAADKSNLAEVKRLVSAGHSVNGTGKFATTPLMRASYRGDDQMVQYLLQNGAEINAADEGGMTALTLAGLGKSASTEDLLLASGATGSLYADVEPAAGPLLAAGGLLGGVSGGTAAVAGGAVVAAGAGVAVASSGSGSTSTSSSSTTTTTTTPAPTTWVSTSALTSAEMSSTGLGVTVAVIDNGVYNSGTYTDGDHSGSATSTGAGANSSSPYDFTVANANGVVVWDPNSTDFITAGGSGTPVGSGVMNGHGTETALIINQIASDANILSVRAFDTFGSTENNVKAITQAIDYAATNVTSGVINNSWGLAGTDMSATNAATTAISKLTETIDPFNPMATPYATPYKVVNSISNAITNGNVLVWAAGNNSQANPNITAGLYLIDPNLDQNATGTSLTANPDVAKYWLVAGAVADNGNGTYDITSTASNKCGLTQARCLVAVANSTSHAAAEVSGAVAKLISSGLTPDQAAARVLATAYYLNEAGHVIQVDGSGNTVAFGSGTSLLSGDSISATGEASEIVDSNGTSNNIYGHGVLNSELATSAYGSLFVNTGNGTSALLSGSNIVLSRAFGDALSNSGISFLAFDNNGDANSELGSAHFNVELASMVGSDVSNIDIDAAMSRLGNSRFTNTTEYANGTLNFTPASSEEGLGLVASPEDPQATEVASNFSYTTNIAKTSYTVAQNVKMSDSFGFGAISASDVSLSVLDSSQVNPYLGFMDKGFSMMMKSELSKDVFVKFASFNGTEANKTYLSSGGDVAGGVGEVTYSFDDTSIGVQAGTVIEQGTFLTSDSSGIFSTDGGTPTNFVGISAQNKLSDHLNLFGYYVAGKSTPTAGGDSLFSGGISDITSSAFSLGVSYDGFERKGTSVGFNVAQPLRVESGTASLAYDSGVDASGNITRSSAQLDLSPSGREFDLESYYHMALGEGVSSTISSVYRISPDHIATNDDEAILLFKVQNKF